MITRYETKEMRDVWSEEHKFFTWALIELKVIEARKALGMIDVEVLNGLLQQLVIDPDEIKRIEDSGVDHDMIAFLMHISPQIPEELRPHLHYLLTSYDVEDTALMIFLRESIDHIAGELGSLMKVLERRAFEFKDTPQIGRTHLVHAEPITFGVKLALWFDECGRQFERLMQLYKKVSVGKLSGAVGMYTLPPEVEAKVCTMLDVTPIPATQIIGRDIVAEYLSTMANIGGTLDKIAMALRLMQQTEVRETQEYFNPKQRGSSAMPHKRNPIKSENVCGLSQILRGYALAGFENQMTMHERTLENSSRERVILADASHLVHFCLRRLATTIDKLLVYPDRMLHNLGLTLGLIYSQNVQALVAEKSGLPREDAYKLVRDVAQACWDSGEKFLHALKRNSHIMLYVTEDELAACFDLKEKIKYRDEIFKRIF